MLQFTSLPIIPGLGSQRSCFPMDSIGVPISRHKPQECTSSVSSWWNFILGNQMGSCVLRLTLTTEHFGWNMASLQSQDWLNWPGREGSLPWKDIATKCPQVSADPLAHLPLQLQKYLSGGPIGKPHIKLPDPRTFRLRDVYLPCGLWNALVITTHIYKQTVRGAQEHSCWLMVS